MNLPNPFPNNAVQSRLVKAGNTGTLIAVVLDESSSMAPTIIDTIKGFNYLKQQQTLPDTKLTLCKFSTSSSIVYNALDIREAQELNTKNYTPGGGTALLDAIGKTVEQINATLASIPENFRPSVILTIMTDGEENSSRKYNYGQIKELIQEAQSNNWAVNFLGANIDTFQVGSALGLDANYVSSYNVNNMTGTLAAQSAVINRYRDAATKGLSMATVGYTSEDRTKMSGE